MKKLLDFDTMIVPQLIKFIYWFMLVMAVLNGLRIMAGGGFGGFISGLIMIVAGALVARIACEILIVLFKMNEALQDMRKKPE